MFTFSVYGEEIVNLSEVVEKLPRTFNKISVTKLALFLHLVTYKASCSIPMPRTLPIQAPMAMLGINNPAGT